MSGGNGSLSAAWAALVVVATASLAACSRDKAPEPAAQDLASASSASAASLPAPAVVQLSDRISRPAAPRVVAIGDLHGDLEHAQAAFRLAGAIDDDDHWKGGNLVVVQTGDDIDRGDDDRAILDHIERWKTEAKAAGGELIVLDGNHELMNANFDFRYVSAASLASFASFADPKHAPYDKVAPEAQGRAAAFAPGGPYAKILASRPLFVKVGDAFFVHGGILPETLDAGLDALNDGTHEWLLGTRPAPPPLAMGESGPVWTRAYSDPGHEDCQDLAKVNAALGVKRMVVGHTVQKDGVSSACTRQVWRIDVGMSHVYGGPVQVLEIRGDEINVLRGAPKK